MKRLLILLMVFLGGVSPVKSSPWPYYSFDIIGYMGDYSSVQYGNARTYWREIPDSLKSYEQTTILSAWGIHCRSGNKPGEFTSCVWVISGHAPSLVDPNKCRTTQDDNWILVSPQACEVYPSFDGQHSGAFPGAECAVLAKSLFSNSSVVSGPIDTPFGLLTPGEVANSRNTYCIKASKPVESCDINIPNGGILDHGIQSPTSTSTRTLDVDINCGANPVITLVDNTINLDNNHIKSELTLVPNGSKYLLKSVLTSINAAAGVHSGSTIAIVSAL